MAGGVGKRTRSIFFNFRGKTLTFHAFGGFLLPPGHAGTRVHGEYLRQESARSAGVPQSCRREPSIQ